MGLWLEKKTPEIWLHLIRESSIKPWIWDLKVGGVLLSRASYSQAFTVTLSHMQQICNRRVWKHFVKNVKISMNKGLIIKFLLCQHVNKSRLLQMRQNVSTSGNGIKDSIDYFAFLLKVCKSHCCHPCVTYNYFMILYSHILIYVLKIYEESRDKLPFPTFNKSAADDFEDI